jgi:hypothetical protein
MVGSEVREVAFTLCRSRVYNAAHGDRLEQNGRNIIGGSCVTL